MKSSIYMVNKTMNAVNGKNNKATNNGENSSSKVFSYTEYRAADGEYNKNSKHDRNFTLRSKELKKRNSRTKKTGKKKYNGSKNSSQVVGKSIKSILLKSPKNTTCAQQLITPINWNSLSSSSMLRGKSVLSSYTKIIHMPVGSVTALQSLTSLTQSCNNTNSKRSPQTVTFRSSHRKPSITDPVYLYQNYKKNWKNCHIPGESCIPICLETRNSLPFISNQ